MHINPHTLRNHLAKIYEKLGVHRRVDLVFYALENGLDTNVIEERRRVQTYARPRSTAGARIEAGF
jgi:hypothetical protein